ncbi:MAG: carboxynorspermidine decarboxylase [Proteobacteria bacterium]|nr:carboxynorspermidine decarboxylase [Pseudomonadota bacterium]NOG59767.1 carboxynorspermidine decarboxylase [Pseudomonadota bacterium]
MKDSIFNNTDLMSPAYVYDQDKIVEVLARLTEIKENTDCFPLYSIKSANISGLLKIIKPYVDGFSCSSLFEVQLAKEILDDSQTIHITTPGYREDEWDQILELTDFITLNSATQAKNYSEKINSIASCGIRINPELSFINDERYDPCRTYSKLGVSLNDIADKKINIDWQFIEGLHIHNNCESNNFEQLKQTVDKVMSAIPLNDCDLKWINLGGGYFLNNETDTMPLISTINLLQENYGVDVYFEPGKGITGHAGYLLATVIDLFVSEGKQIIVLDVTINHLPEVFEYQYQPKVMNTCDKSDYEYRLTGCSCLSGDIFGDYYFDTPLQTGSKVVFENVGAYMQVKANMFNGINLPVTYLFNNDEKFKLLKQYDYDSFRSRL